MPRSFSIFTTFPSTPPITDLGHALVDIAKRIGLLQTRIAEEYGTIDSVEVFQETKARVLSRRDAQSVSVMKTLYALRAPPRIPNQAACASLSSQVGMVFDTKRQVMRTNSFHCVSDALFVEKCLTKDLDVPKGRIQRIADIQTHIYLSDPSIPSHVNDIRTSRSSLHRARHTSMASESCILLIFEEQRRAFGTRDSLMIARPLDDYLPRKRRVDSG
ncbi:hypothetical protein EDD85DRAFT_941430 [Armillaria nabsnona]|nr:hypothetical protein EDD85DRAFT_941430 [Armillaria nabsnona]